MALWLSLVALGIGGFAFADTDKAARADAGKASPKAPIGNKKDANAKSSPAAAANDDKKKKSDADSANEEAKKGSKTTEKYAAPTPKPLPKLADDEGRNASVLVIPIKGTIDLGLAPFVARSLENGRKASAIIFDVDTFGGRVDAAVQIRDAILGTTVPTSPTSTDARSVRVR